MGEKFCLTEDEINIWKGKLEEVLSKFNRDKDVTELILFFIWSYEFLEGFTSTKLVKAAKLQTVKEYFQIKFDKSSHAQLNEILNRFFRLRGTLVHKPYKITNDEILAFFEANIESIFTLFDYAEVGFKKYTVSIIREGIEVTNKKNKNSVTLKTMSFFN